MTEKRITRRQAIQLAGAAAIAGGMSGCGAAASAARVVISVAWKTITSVASAVVKYADKALTVVALVEEVRKTLNASLTEEQANSLRSGGKLYLKTEDGKEHEIPFTTS